MSTDSPWSIGAGPQPALAPFCSVCGSQATGTHYKSVFRRSLILNRVYYCREAGSSNKKCYDESRCKKCRLALCLAGGMAPAAVLKDKRKTNQKINNSSSEAVAQFVPNPPNFECKLDKIMQNLLALEDAHHELRISNYSPQLVPGLSIEHFMSGPSQIGVEYGPMQLQPYEPESAMVFPEEVFIKKRVCFDFSKFDYSRRKFWIFQRVLLASAITCSNFTSAFYSYSCHSDKRCFPDGTVMNWSRELQELAPNSTKFHAGLITAIREAQLDRREYSLLKMILVCNPMLTGLCPYDVTLLQHEKERYAKVLFSYILAKHGVKEGPAIFHKHLSIIDRVNTLTTWQKNQHILILSMGLYKYRIPLAETMFHSH